MTKIVVVIPALNEAGSIGMVLDEIFDVLKDENFKVLVVDGRSTDGTDKIAKEKGAVVIYQSKIGYGNALAEGFMYAKERLNADILVMMDADLTYDAKDIPKLIKPIIANEADFVVGNRFRGMQKGSMSFVNRFGNRVLSWFVRKTLKINVHDTQCGIRAFKAELLKDINLTCEGMPFATEMLAEAKFASAKILETPVNYRPRIGKTKLNPIKDGLMIFGTILRLLRDTSPLLFFGGIGVIFMIVGIILGLDVTFEWFRTGTVGRIPTLLLVVLLVMGGIQFFAVGLLADMIKRFKRK